MSKELIERLRSKAAKCGYGAYSDPLMSKAADRIEQLEAEVERLNSDCNVVGKANESLGIRVIEAEKSASESQAREQQLRRLSDAGFKAIAAISGGVISDLSVQSIRNIEQIGSDTTALEAMIQRAGEVMRERCASHITSGRYMVMNPLDTYTAERHSKCVQAHDAYQAKEIRALPGVTLEDLK